MRIWLSRSLAVLLLVPGLGMVALDPASAGQCQMERILVQAGDGNVQYQRKQVCPVGVTPGTSPVVVTGAPSCDITSASPATFCLGSTPCYYRSSVVPYSPPAAPPPTPGAPWRVRYCLTPGQSGTAGWVPLAMWVGQAPQPPPLRDQAVEAAGQIKMPSAVLSFNPTVRTLVNLDTWFWAQGLSPGVLRGSSALGLVAYATPDRLEVTPGDGSAVRTCPWVTVRPQVPADQSGPCSYAYFRSSIGGSARGPDGGPAYEASAQAFWSLRFELNGAPVQIAGAPSELPGPVMTTAVEVGEVQTLVTGTG
jgi:hypothetical protein